MRKAKQQKPFSSIVCFICLLEVFVWTVGIYQDPTLSLSSNYCSNNIDNLGRYNNCPRNLKLFQSLDLLLLLQSLLKAPPVSDLAKVPDPELERLNNSLSLVKARKKLKFRSLTPAPKRKGREAPRIN
jgi:hypothetical protein